MNIENYNTSEIFLFIDLFTRELILRMHVSHAVLKQKKINVNRKE